MATQVLIAHTGQRLQLDTSQFSTLDDFKDSVARQTSIPAQQLVALTSAGKNVKYQMLYQEAEIYVYDRRITATGSNASVISEVPAPKRYRIPQAPGHIENPEDVASWKDLCHNRRAWALSLANDCSHMANTAHERYGEMDVMTKCLDAAVANLELSVKQVQPRHEELNKWVQPTLEENQQLARNFDKYLALARATPVSPAMAAFMTSTDAKKKQATLEDLIALEPMRKATSSALASEAKFRAKAGDLSNAAEAMYRGLEQLISDFDGLVGRSTMMHSNDALQLLEDIEAVAGKIDTDAKIVQEYGNTHRDLAQASKAAQNHTERLIPTLKRRAKEMEEMLLYATNARNVIASEVIQFMRSVSDITATHGSVKNLINALNHSEEEMKTFDYLRLIHQLPYMYASFVVESIRRREWSDKIKADSSTLANEMALFQDEEAKRRRRWQKTVGSMYGEKLGSSVIGLEVNLLGEEEVWPQMAKSDLDEFLEHLQKQAADAEVVEDVAKLIGELNSPTKQQSKRVKAFKNGSVHEAALGRSGLLIRGDDELLRNLQADKAKLESKLKTADSRVRRLEDLLHRNHHATRPSLGSLFGHERNDSAASLRSTNDEARRGSTDTLNLKIQQLEADLQAERDRSASFQKDLNTRLTQHNDMQGQMDEVNSTKKDLLGNMEALKREFDEERKSLEDEIKLLKSRIEEHEDDMDHFGESRENEKAGYDTKMHALEQEVARLQKEKQDEALKAQGQVEFLRTEARLQHERNEVLEKQLQLAQEENKDLTTKLEGAQADNDARLKALRDIHELLSPGEPAAEDGTDMMDALVSRSSDVVSRARATENDKSILKSDLEEVSGQVKALKEELSEVKERLSAEEETAMHLRESLAEEKARVTALEGDSADGRAQLNELRRQIADGETGSESLRKKLEEEEQRLTSMTEELASRQSQVGSLEEELHMFKEKLHGSQDRVTELTKRFEARTEHSKDLTQRLYAQNDRICRLLERLGFAVTRDGGSMSIQKIPRAERGSLSLTQAANDSSDPGQASIRRSATFSSRTMADSTDLELLHWMNSNDTDMEEEKYKAFMDKLGSFDIDLFGETMYRRVKDIEHLAKKLQRDGKAYRDKARTLQKDAHEKIAYKHFKEGDLALFLPTRNQSAGAWAAFNVGFPHYFLREQDSHRLKSREWLVARITRVEERVVDLSKSLHKQLPDSDSMNEEDDNPFQLSDGLRWYMIDAHEDKAGAPSTPGLGKSTTAATNVEARADMHSHAKATGKDKLRPGPHNIDGVSKVLSKSLESRRSSSNSKKAVPFAGGAALLKGNAVGSETNSLRAAAPETPEGASPPPQEGGAGPGSADQGREQERDASESRGSPVRLAREASGASIESPSKKSVVWDSLWNVDVSYESGKRKAAPS